VTGKVKCIRAAFRIEILIDSRSRTSSEGSKAESKPVAAKVFGWTSAAVHPLQGQLREFVSYRLEATCHPQHGWSKLILVRARTYFVLGLHFELTPYSHSGQLFKRAGLQ
jgi:hypothetical protein